MAKQFTQDELEAEMFEKINNLVILACVSQRIIWVLVFYGIKRLEKFGILHWNGALSSL